jgi:hypothetical protein
VPDDTPSSVDVEPGVVRVATAVVPLTQLPLADSVRAIEEPIHTRVGPVIAAGFGFTVTVITDAVVQPEPLVTV